MDDHDLLVRIDEKLSALTATFEAHAEEERGIHEDHAHRLGDLEVWRWRWAGILSVAMFVLSIVGPSLARAMWGP